MATITANTGLALDWSSTATWVGAAVPTSADDAVVPSGSEVAVGSLDNAQGTLITVESGGALRLGSESLYVPVTVESGGTFYLDSGANVYAAVNVAGTLSAYSGNVYLRADVTINNGGTLVFATSSVYLYNYETLTVENGGTATFDYSGSYPYNYGVIVGETGSTIVLGYSFYSSGAAIVYSGGTTTIQNTPSVIYTVVVTGGTLTQGVNYAPYAVTILGGTYRVNNVSTTPNFVDAIGGTMQYDGASASLLNLVAVASGGTVEFINSATNSGTVVKYTGGTVTGTTVDFDHGAARSEDQAAIADVRSGTTFADSQLTGTLTVPAVGDVQDGVGVDATTGTLELPTVAQVESGVSYGAGGSEYTGTLSASGGGGGPIGIGF